MQGTGAAEVTKSPRSSRSRALGRVIPVQELGVISRIRTTECIHSTSLFPSLSYLYKAVSEFSIGELRPWQVRKMVLPWPGPHTVFFL